MRVDFNHIPDGWKKIKISKKLFFQEGPGVRKWQFTEEGIKLLNVGNINLGKVDLSATDKHLSTEEATGKYAHFLVDEGDLLIACSGIVVDNFHNKIAFAKKEHLPLCLNTSTMRFKALKDDVDLNYFKYYLQTVHFTSQLQKLITGSAQLNFGPSHIKKIDFLLPPLKTQKHTAQILDDAAALRDKTKQLLKEYDLLAQAIFLDMFGDPFNNNKNFEKGTIRDLVKEAKYGTSSKASEVGKFCYLRMNNITYSGYMNYEKLKYVDIPQKDLSKYIVRKGDILFNRTNSKELVGKTAIFDSDIEMIAAGYLIRLRLNEKGNPYFVWGYLNSKHGKLILKNMSKSIVGMANINAQELQNIKILQPPIELQNQFAEKIDLIEQQKAIAKQELQESEDLFNCLLQKAFKGELV
jgi:type I restriction enzyme S subunit